jgi:hypothetical protein
MVISGRHPMRIISALRSRVRRLHHREFHRHGDEAAWWTHLNIDPAPIAFARSGSTHRDGAFRRPAAAGPQFEVATSVGVS